MSEIIIRRGLPEEAGALLREKIGGSKAAIVTDDKVAKHYLQRLTASLERAGYEVFSHALPHGEKSKDLAHFSQVIDFLQESELTRSDPLLALGGGVVGDLAGFAAACYLRGLPLVQLPSTLLACVDSAIGGKTGIDLPRGKNLLGAFYPAKLVLMDHSLLRTLPARHYRDGLAEVVKYAAIMDRGLFDLLPYDESEEEAVIRRCVDCKCKVVKEDPHDKGQRQLLNFGHSVGHALEKLSNYRLSHGRAVSIGMAAMAKISVRLGLCQAGEMGQLVNMLRLLGLPVTTKEEPEAIFSAMLADKKRAGDSMTLVLMHGIGDCRLHSLPLSEVRALLRPEVLQ